MVLYQGQHPGLNKILWLQNPELASWEAGWSILCDSILFLPFLVSLKENVWKIQTVRIVFLLPTAKKCNFLKKWAQPPFLLENLITFPYTLCNSRHPVIKTVARLLVRLLDRNNNFSYGPVTCMQKSQACGYWVFPNGIHSCNQPPGSGPEMQPRSTQTSCRRPPPCSSLTGPHHSQG